jgi:dCMP deaminase|uniref:dCMP deaminase family protein n=1 Tax=Desulfobacca acetoxidans TaxID=60893 RepID=A0A7C5ELT4_9BACT
MRPSWDEYFMLIAKLVSTRSTCNSRPTGAVLVKDRQILATGYNGSMPGAPHCADQVLPDGSPYCHRRALHIDDFDKYNFCRASHAEANAIAQAARHGVAIKGASLYVTLEPCYVCVKLLATAQIERVFFELPYESRDDLRDAYWKQAVAEAGFKEYRQLTISPEALAYILPRLTEITSLRRLPATRPLEKRPYIGAVESD